MLCGGAYGPAYRKDPAEANFLEEQRHTMFRTKVCWGSEESVS
jgi:hypothetical protein